MTNEQIADKWIQEMSDAGLTASQMIEVIRLAKEKYKRMKKECPECLNKVSIEELQMFGGICEQCHEEINDG